MAHKIVSIRLRNQGKKLRNVRKIIVVEQLINAHEPGRKCNQGREKITKNEENNKKIFRAKENYFIRGRVSCKDRFN